MFPQLKHAKLSRTDAVRGVMYTWSGGNVVTEYRLSDWKELKQYHIDRATYTQAKKKMQSLIKEGENLETDKKID